MEFLKEVGTTILSIVLAPIIAIITIGIALPVIVIVGCFWWVKDIIDEI